MCAITRLCLKEITKNTRHMTLTDAYDVRKRKKQIVIDATLSDRTRIGKSST